MALTLRPWATRRDALPRRKRDFSHQLQLRPLHTHGPQSASEVQALPRDPSKLGRQGQLCQPHATSLVLHSPEGPCVTALGSCACTVNPFSPSEHVPVRGLCSGAHGVRAANATPVQDALPRRWGGGTGNDACRHPLSDTALDRGPGQRHRAQGTDGQCFPHPEKRIVSTQTRFSVS